MQLERYINDEGEFRCFAVSNEKLSRSGMAKILSELDGVEITKRPKYNDIDVFCEFSFSGHEFEIAEPYGDNSTYDVCSKEPDLKALTALADYFESSSPIRGGDTGHIVFSLINMAVSSLIFCVLALVLWRGVTWIIS
jgi:hypothetical protein